MDELSFKTTLLETQLETTIDGILVVDEQSNIVLYNQRFADMWHIPKSLMVSKNDNDVLECGTNQMKDPVGFKKRVIELYSHKDQKSRDEIEFKDGRIFDRYSSPLISKNGQYLGRIWYFRDITALKQVEDRVIRLSKAVEQASEGIVITDLGKRVEYANNAWAQMHGYTPEEAVGLHIADLQTDKHRETFINAVQHMKDNDGWAGETSHKRKDGTVFLIQISTSLLKNDEGKPIGSIAVCSDITERKRIENALRESEDRYRALVESAGETIAVINRNGEFLFMNTTAAKRIGGKAEDYIGKTMWDVFPKEIADRQVGSIRKVMDSGKGETFVTQTAIQGKLLWYETTIEPLRNNENQIYAALIIGRDISKIKNAQEELEIYREEVSHAERLASLGTLSATAAHELAQPLTVIRLLIENAMTKLQNTTSPETVIDKLRESLTEISNITSVVNRLRNFARKSAEKTTKDINLKTIANRIVNLFQGSSLHPKIEIVIKDIDELPSIYANEKGLEQMFFALIDNAVQAAGDKQDRKIIISGTEFDDYVEIRFEDNCGGIAPENIERIFTPFFTTKPANQGTGLGLCIVSDIISRLGGKIRVESELDKGASFFVTIPLNQDMK